MAFDFSMIYQYGLKAGIAFMILLVGIFIAGIIGAAFYYKKKNKEYAKYKVVIWKRYKDKDGHEMPMIIDLNENGRVYKDKKLNKWSFHLKKANIDLGQEEAPNMDEDRSLDLPTLPYAGGGELLFIEQLGKRKYAIGKAFMVEGQVKVMVTTADVAEALRSYKICMDTYSKKQSPLWAFVIYVTFAVLILILIVVVLNKLEVLQQFGDKWIEGARMMAGPSPGAVPSTVVG